MHMRIRVGQICLGCGPRNRVVAGLAQRTNLGIGGFAFILGMRMTLAERFNTGWRGFRSRAILVPRMVFKPVTDCRPSVYTIRLLIKKAKIN